MKPFAHWFMCSEMIECANFRIIPRVTPNQGGGGKWLTLVHRATTARRVTGELLVSHASRFSIGSRLAA